MNRTRMGSIQKEAPPRHKDRTIGRTAITPDRPISSEDVEKHAGHIFDKAKVMISYADRHYGRRETTICALSFDSAGTKPPWADDAVAEAKTMLEEQGYKIEIVELPSKRSGAAQTTTINFNIAWR